MEEKISVIIPNFNGQELLAKNLPTVINNCPNAQIIVVDDGSTDDSQDFIKKKFPKVKLIINNKNLGFTKTVNRGVKDAKGQYVLLLNSDVAPRSGFLEKALAHFKSADTNLFGVGLMDMSHENFKIVERGRGGASFKRGFLNHFALDAESGETLWISGGSSLIYREKFLDLGGFDPVFAPFYWEDIDLCYRARKKGYSCIFEADSKVDHFHEEGAIKKSHSEFFIKTVSYKNQFLFVWKNISAYDWIIEHFLWLPYHFARAMFNFDPAFFAGFFWALSKIPALIMEDSRYTIVDTRTDKEILNAFGK